MKINPDKIPFFMELMFSWAWGYKISKISK